MAGFVPEREVLQVQRCAYAALKYLAVPADCRDVFYPFPETAPPWGARMLEVISGDFPAGDRYRTDFARRALTMLAHVGATCEFAAGRDLEDLAEQFGQYDDDRETELSDDARKQAGTYLTRWLASHRARLTLCTQATVSTIETYAERKTPVFIESMLLGHAQEQDDLAEALERFFVAMLPSEVGPP